MTPPRKTGAPRGVSTVADVLASLPADWREQAATLRDVGAEPNAKTLEWAAMQLENALRTAADSLLSLQEAAGESGYAVDTLRHKIAANSIPNAGRKHAPLIRRGDLPKRARGLQPSEYDPLADALAIARKQRAS